MIKEIGLKNIFHDKYELTFISIVVIASLIYSMVIVKEISIHVEDIYKSIFIVSPILYIIISLFSFFNSKEKGTFELEMTCKYNLYKILVLRMFIFSVVTILVNTIIIIGVFTLKNDIDILRAICISITGLFLFSSSFLCITMKVKKEMSKLLVISLWVIVNIGLYSINKELYNFFLKEAPVYIHLTVTVLCVTYYIKSLKNLINFRCEKGEF